MSINFINLKYFYDAVKLGSVSAAAKANFVTQSAISQAITKLEKSLGIALVAHHPNRFRLTPEGETAFQQAWEILKKAANFKENLTKGNIGHLEFACTRSFAVAVVPKFLKQFKAAHPHVNINFYMGKNAEIKQMLKTGLIDFGIGPDEGDLIGWEKQNIYAGNFGLYISSSLKKKQIQELGFILSKGDCKDTAFFKEAYRKKHKKEPTISLEVSSWEMIANLTSEGLGIGYFPDYIALKRKDDLKAYNFDLMPFPYQIAAFFPKGMKLRKSSEIFLSSIKSAQKIVK